MRMQITQLSLPGALAKPIKKRTKQNGTITLVYPANAPIAAISGRWRRLLDGRIEATYTREELELCKRFDHLYEETA